MSRSLLDYESILKRFHRFLRTGDVCVDMGAYGRWRLGNVFTAMDYTIYDIFVRILDRKSFGASSRHQAAWDCVVLPSNREAAELLATQANQA